MSRRRSIQAVCWISYCALLISMAVVLTTGHIHPALALENSPPEGSSGIELVGRSADEPPLEWWLVDDVQSDRRVAQVKRRWGFTPLPPGEYRITIIPQGRNALDVSWGRVKVTDGRVTRVKIDSGIELTAHSANQSPLEWWFVEDKKRNRRVAQVYKRWGFTPLPPGRYRIEAPLWPDPGTAEDLVVEAGTVLTVPMARLGVGRLDIELPAARGIQLVAGSAEFAVGFYEDDQVKYVRLSKGKDTLEMTLWLREGPTAIQFRSGDLRLEVPVTVVAGETQPIPFDAPALAQRYQLSLFDLIIRDQAGEVTDERAQLILQSAGGERLLAFFPNLRSGTTWLSPDPLVRVRLDDREQIRRNVPVAEPVELVFDFAGELKDGIVGPTTVDIVIESPTNGAIMEEEQVTVVGRASTAAPAGATQLALVIDSSGSTADPSGVDIDGDGKQESILQAEVAAGHLLLDKLEEVEAQTPGTAFAVTLVRFSDQAEIMAPLIRMTDTAGVRALHRALDRLLEEDSGGDTYYDRALDQAIQAFAEAGRAGPRIILLLSDGKPSDLIAALAGAGRAGAAGAVIHTFGLGPDFTGTLSSRVVFPPYPSRGADILAMVAALGQPDGEATPLPRPGEVVQIVPRLPILELPEVQLKEVQVTNLTTGESAPEVQLSRDGAFQSEVPVSLLPWGEHASNTLAATAIAIDGVSKATDEVQVRSAISPQMHEWLEDLRRNKANLEKTNRELTAEVERLQKDLRDAQASILTLKQEKERILGNITAGAQALARQLVGRLQEILSEKDRLIRACQLNSLSLERKHADLLEQNQTIEAEVAECSGRLSAAQRRIEELVQKVREREQELSALRAERDRLSERLQEDVKTAQAEIDRLQTELEAVRAEKDRLDEMRSPAMGMLRVLTATPTGEGEIPLELLPQIELILDASNSMWGRVEGQAKIVIAKEVIEQVIDNLPDEVQVALRLYGHRTHFRNPGACRDSELVYPFARIDKPRLKALVRAIKPQGSTPIAFSLQQITHDFGDVPGEKIIVLVTDGKEECGGSPSAAIAHLQERGFEIIVHVVGFALEDETTKREMQRVAELTSGRFFDAQDAGALRRALNQSLAVPYDVIDSSGERVTSGTLDQGELELQEGIYTVVVRAPRRPIRIENVRIVGNKATRIRLESEGPDIAPRIEGPNR